jgi:DivIVA domain-containing protein
MRMAEEHRTFSPVRMREAYDIGEVEEFLDRLAEELRSPPRPRAPVPWAVLAVIALVVVVLLVLVR